MADGTTILTARCLCGACNHELHLSKSSLPLKTLFCHCNSCRHVTGALCLTAVNLPDNYEPTKALLSKMKTYQFSNKFTNYFCHTCGTQMLGSMALDDGKREWQANSGSLDMADGIFDLHGHMFVEDTKDGGLSDWLTSIAGKSIPRWATWPEESEELSKGWQAFKNEAPKPSSTEKLHAHCHCGGINFYISHPSAQSANTTSPWPDVLVPFNSGPVDLPENESWWLRANKQKFLAGVCACDSCRLAFGTEFIQWAFVPTVDISISADGKTPFSREFGTLKGYRSSKVATRRFCGECGATVFWDGDVRPGLIDVAVGLCDAEEGARAESWFEWRTERLSYREDAVGRAESLVLGIEQGMERYAKESQGRDGPHEEVQKVQDSQ